MQADKSKPGGCGWCVLPAFSCSFGRFQRNKGAYKYTGKEFFDEVSINVVDYLKGDMDKNGAINSIDASILIDKYKSNEITDEDYAIGDMNNDNTLNSTDASIIIDLYKSNEVLN